MLDDYLKQDEAAKILGIKSHTLQIWRQKKTHPELKFIKIGRIIRYRKTAIEEFMRVKEI